ncbi:MULTISPECIES: RNA recognition motif domain-containing protein [unclassified Tolypothrix]|uniref:RNA recognition motif domain-containing protein n=1 Tax=unclassified Tolypothrix TaxID=2649714 RepID=UPI0005EAA5F7|nr:MULTISPECIES: RNA-binding protein [unclassified Tolypothrix]BAY91472.1 RNA-binding region RNP-1 [Microchaete diplosiphon NIES-3275]EKF05479.1 RNA-binding region [Tolypothrix sp. PCC 7601]MBE9087009.1 RNA-binding protein [Tolypothrix sp. LEGE 11397]UYD25506.1 RNA-binding protein [Tolypothrix sp. PCC 7712]UYD32253.1 RNA-binding protein [Tolypothrix sp. PCC 7601]
MSVYIGNLSHEIEDEDIRQVFLKYGSVKRILVSTKQKSGEKRGFAIVQMEKDTDEVAAINGLQGTEWMGYSLKVNRAKTIADAA